MKKEYISPSIFVCENMQEPILQGESQWRVGKGNNEMIKDDDGTEDDGFVIDAKNGNLWDGWDD